MTDTEQLERLQEERKKVLWHLKKNYMFNNKGDYIGIDRDVYLAQMTRHNMALEILILMNEV